MDHSFVAFLVPYWIICSGWTLLMDCQLFQVPKSRFCGTRGMTSRVQASCVMAFLLMGIPTQHLGVCGYGFHGDVLATKRQGPT